MAVIFKARLLAEEAGAQEIGISHFVSALGDASAKEEAPRGRAMPLSKKAKAAIAAAIKSAGNRDELTVDHLQSALL